jgi:hypothetical protein
MLQLPCALVVVRVVAMVSGHDRACCGHGHIGQWSDDDRACCGHGQWSRSGKCIFDFDKIW